MSEKIKEYVDRYNAALHAVQTGVAMKMQLGEMSSTSPKHLRTGINSALVNCAGIAQLLMDKGIFTEEEYFRYQAEWMENEQRGFEEELSDKLNKKVTLA